MNLSIKYLLGFLVLIVSTVWMAFLSYDNNFHIVTCDVGQGDASLVFYGSTQILIDGGPNSKVIDCLSKHLPFWDREIEGVILTHPESDHYTGLIEVFKRYEVQYFLANNLDSGSQGYQVLKNEVGGSGAEVINVTAGFKMRFGLIYLDILHPSDEFVSSNSTPKITMSEVKSDVLGARTTKSSVNEFSIVSVLSYGDFDALFTGDINPDISNELSGVVQSYGKTIEYIKVPHHGSRNGLTKSLLNATDPKAAVITVGKNSYGHPHKDILELLHEYGVKVYRTDIDGEVDVEVDKNTFIIN